MLTGVVKLAPNLPFDSVPPFLHLERKFMHLGFQSTTSGSSRPTWKPPNRWCNATVLVLLVLVVLLNMDGDHVAQPLATQAARLGGMNAHAESLGVKAWFSASARPRFEGYRSLSGVGGVTGVIGPRVRKVDPPALLSTA